jgi:DNA-binding transcriptional ArsR family regulator
MKKNKADVIFHPVRIRIVQTLFGSKQLTAQQLVGATGGCSIATLYRHLNQLVEAEVIAVVEERPMRGAVEKVYALAPNSSLVFTPEDWRTVSPQDQLRYFNILIGTLLNDFGRYVGQPTFDRGNDGVITKQMSLELTDEEAREVDSVISNALQPYYTKTIRPNTRRRILTSILLPIIETEIINKIENTENKKSEDK